MKKLVKIMVAAILMASSLGAMTLEDHNGYIAKENNPALKQALICEREAAFIFKNPMECTKAAQISLNEYNSIQKKWL